MSGRSNTRQTTLKLTITALFMAMVIALSSFGIPVPGGHLYLNDTVIVLAAMLLDPFLAFMKNTDEARRVMRKKGKMYYTAYVRIEPIINSLDELYKFYQFDC